jgi:alkylation response protein AidB-like acyl-CoA dehydrogenase
VSANQEVEDVEYFRQRARRFIRTHLRPVTPGELRLDRFVSDDDELNAVARCREVQRMLFDADLAGICFPTEYGGQGLTHAHQRVLNEELTGYEFPAKLQVPTLSPCAAILLEFGTEAQKLSHIPAMLKGEELWMQFLSEPSGGSDIASALTTAVRDGDEWVLSGSKVWTTGAWWSDWGLCLARTNWDVPKHRGLTVFVLPIRQAGVEVHRIEMLNGSKEFCQEFLTDVRIPDTDRVGNLDDGWTVGTRWLFHERMLYNSPYVSFPAQGNRGGLDATVVYEIAQELDRLDDADVLSLIGEARVLELVADHLGRRITEGLRLGTSSDQASAVTRLFRGVAAARIRTMALDVAGPAGAAFTGEGAAADAATRFLMRQAGSIAGGTLEMARNAISERILAMPRERAVDRDTPFRDVPRSRSSDS